MRIGQDESRHQRAVKVWDKREFRNLDDRVELGTRNIKVALRRLRQWARDGAADELDLDGTIRATAEHGWLDVQTRPERRNAVKVLLFLDIGGSMDPHVKVMEELFTAARAEFKQLVPFYFHNCLYEGVWRDNHRRWSDQTPTWDILRTYGRDYKAIFVGDAAMSPYEILQPGGANEHWNREAGQVWLTRACTQWPHHLWINPVPEAALALHPVHPTDSQNLRRKDGADDVGRVKPGDQGPSDEATFQRPPLCRYRLRAGHGGHAVLHGPHRGVGDLLVRPRPSQ